MRILFATTAFAATLGIGFLQVVCRPPPPRTNTDSTT